jgi:hypothetical protein
MQYIWSHFAAMKERHQLLGSSFTRKAFSRPNVGHYEEMGKEVMFVWENFTKELYLGKQ